MSEELKTPADLKKDNEASMNGAGAASFFIHLMIYPWAYAFLTHRFYGAWWFVPACLTVTGVGFCTWACCACAIHQYWTKK